ncbi:hypothetical protein KC325_g216 [Hortaea werneckii]|nr:hypothetical protein KC325_g216 [Hortaea werneckii]
MGTQLFVHRSLIPPISQSISAKQPTAFETAGRQNGEEALRHPGRKRTMYSERHLVPRCSSGSSGLLGWYMMLLSLKEIGGVASVDERPIGVASSHRTSRRIGARPELSKSRWMQAADGFYVGIGDRLDETRGAILQALRRSFSQPVARLAGLKRAAACSQTVSLVDGDLSTPEDLPRGRLILLHAPDIHAGAAGYQNSGAT